MTEQTATQETKPTRPEPTTRTGKLAQALRQMPIARQLIPMEAMIGWPIPITRAGKQYVKFPFVGMQPVRREGVTAVLSPPMATVTLDWATGRPVEYVNLRYANPNPDLDWVSEAGTFPHAAVRGSVGDYLTAKERLYQLTDAVLDGAAQGKALSGAEVEEYTALLAKLVEPALLPYYQAIAPRFTERFAGRITDATA